jgi:hypothetical protein
MTVADRRDAVSSEERGFIANSLFRIVPLNGEVGLNSFCLDKLHQLAERKQETTRYLA